MKRLFGEFWRFAVYWLSFSMLAIGSWVERNFGEPSLEQIAYHLQFGRAGLAGADGVFLERFLWTCVLYPFVAALACSLAGAVVAKGSEVGYRRAMQEVARAVTSLAADLWARSERVARFAFARKMQIVLLPASAAFLLSKVSFWDFVQEARYENVIDSYYVAPSSVAPPSERRNLVLIYVESLEDAYRSEELFGRNLLARLDSATEGWHSFGNFVQTTGTSWTMGGIVSTQCGVPLRPYSWRESGSTDGSRDGNALGEKADSFMPGIVCLGDLLKDAGYVNVFMGGADHAFAGKGKFLSAHGYQEIWGRTEWERQGETKMNAWGLFDPQLLFLARKKLDELMGAGRPFNLTLLTLDTHHPHGFVSDVCRDEGVVDFPGVVECTAGLVASFIDYIRSNGYLETTDVVVIGDHLSMVNPVYDQLSRQPHRTIYNRIYSSRALSRNRDDLYHFSIFPSILDMLGFKFPDGRLGLGVSGFGSIGENARGLYSQRDLEYKLAAKSDLYRKFWSGK